MEGRARGVLAKANDIGAACISEHVVDLGCCICEQLGSICLLTLQNICILGLYKRALPINMLSLKLLCYTKAHWNCIVGLA